MDIKEILNNAECGKRLIIEQNLNKLFDYDKVLKEDRTGMHGSGIIASDEEFCYREQVLSFFWKGEEQVISPDLKRIFLEGCSIHEKWQTLFRRAGIALGVEQRGHSKEWDLLYTPDAIVKLIGIKFVVEIKSVNTYQFQKMKSHPSGEKQLQLYMHETCIPNGFVLCEDKNTQHIKVFDFEYDPLKAKPFVQRMFDVKRAKVRYEKTSILPIRKCDKENCKRAGKCAYKNACFNIRRIPLVGE